MRCISRRCDTPLLSSSGSLFYSYLSLRALSPSVPSMVFFFGARGDERGRNRRGPPAKQTVLVARPTAAFGGAAAANVAAERASREKQLASLLAGGFAGALSATITCPMEVVKTHLQASKGGSQVAIAAAATGPLAVARNIARIEGVRGFFRGLVPTLVGILPARSTYFWAYSTTKASLSSRFGESSPVHMASAAVAGIVSNTLTNPIWLMKSRVQLQAGASASNPRVYRGYADAIVKIFREEGIRGFFKGLSASYWGVTEGALHFVVYERIKSRIIAENRAKVARGDYLNSKSPTQRPEELTPFQYLTAAALAKFIASSATYPHEVVRLRMREQPKFVGAVPKYRSMIQSLRLIAREEGRRGLYAGMGTHLARVVPNAALMFFTYETVVRFIERKQAKEAALAAALPKKTDGDDSRRR
jgi:solute carrier family 25, member 33/36